MMGKRGPRPKGEYEDKSSVLSTRISQELRDHLEAAKDKSGLTLSREIERRLRRSFSDDDRALDMFGSLESRALMQMLALSMRTLHNPDNPDATWFNDPWTFDHMRRRLIGILDLYKPAGAPQPLQWEPLEAAAELATASQPAQLAQHVQISDERMPLNATDGEHRFNRIKADLGDIAKRPTIARGTAQELRKAVTKKQARKRK